MSATTNGRSLKERQRQEREELILHAAEVLLLEKGYHEMAMEEIAARVGISKGTVYLHFPSKEDLVFAMMLRSMQRFQTAVAAVLAAEGTPRERLRRLLEFVLQGILSERFRAFTLIAQSQDVRGLILDKKAELVAIKHQMEAPILALLQEGQACGEFDTSIPVPVMLAVFSNLMNTLRYLPLLEAQQIAPDALVHGIIRMFFNGIDAAPPREGA